MILPGYTRNTRRDRRLPSAGHVLYSVPGTYLSVGVFTVEGVRAGLRSTSTRLVQGCLPVLVPEVRSC